MIERGYTYPVDTDGPRLLTFGQAVKAARELQNRISGILGLWRFEEIGLRVIRRGSNFVTYELSQFGKVVGEVPIFKP